jgi:hypothetical protein
MTTMSSGCVTLSWLLAAHAGFALPSPCNTLFDAPFIIVKFGAFPELNGIFASSIRFFVVKWEKQHRASTARRELLWGSGALLPQSLANPLAREIPGLAATASPEILAHLQLLTNWIWEGCGGHLRFAFRISVSFLLTSCLHDIWSLESRQNVPHSPQISAQRVARGKAHACFRLSALRINYHPD